MFALGILIGIYSYLMLLLGLLGILNKEAILLVSCIFLVGSALYFYKNKEDFPIIRIRNRNLRLYLILFLILAFVNLVGALGPELSFDALWYHLTLPKIFLQSERIFPITQGIFYYSVMPKLGEMIFTPAVAFNIEAIAKLTQWVFGILTSIVVYKISRRYFDEKKSFIAVLIFYSSIVIAWESTVAYVDLIRAFFEAMSLWGLLIWFENKDKKILIESAVFLGLAISTKLMALGSIPIFLILILFFEKNKIFAVKSSAVFFIATLLSALPWFFLSFVSTGNPIFPVISESYSTGSSLSLLNPLNIARDLFVLFVRADDPISPLFIIFLPLTLLCYRKLNKDLKITTIYFFVALFIWYFIPRMGGGRFILPYLPAASILCVGLISEFKNKLIIRYSYLLIIFVFITTIFYRGLANVRYLPVIFGFESKDKFLSSKLNFKFGDFYDTDGWFKNNISEKDKVLLYGFHNLYYADFPFVHESYVKKGDRFNYIATQDSTLPDRFSFWKLIYRNNKTDVNVYSLGGEWVY